MFSLGSHIGWPTIFQYGGHAQFLSFAILNSAILQCGRQGCLFKYNLSFNLTLKSVIFKL
jgi:hypothetical protein